MYVMYEFNNEERARAKTREINDIFHKFFDARRNILSKNPPTILWTELEKQFPIVESIIRTKKKRSVSYEEIFPATFSGRGWPWNFSKYVFVKICWSPENEETVRLIGEFLSANKVKTFVQLHLDENGIIDILVNESIAEDYKIEKHKNEERIERLVKENLELRRKVNEEKRNVDTLKNQLNFLLKTFQDKMMVSSFLTEAIDSCSRR